MGFLTAYRLGASPAPTSTSSSLLSESSDWRRKIVLRFTCPAVQVLRGSFSGHLRSIPAIIRPAKKAEKLTLQSFRQLQVAILWYWRTGHHWRCGLTTAPVHACR